MILQSQESTLQEEVGEFPGRNLLGQLWKQKIKDYHSDRRDLVSSSFMTQCPLIALKKW